MSQGWRTTPLPPNWATLRQQRFTIDGWACIDCGLTDETGRLLQADHIGAPNDHRLQALRTRCENCHKRVTHQRLAQARQKRAALKNRPPEPHPGKVAETTTIEPPDSPTRHDDPPHPTTTTSRPQPDPGG